MALNTCGRCKGFLWDWKVHKCPPVWHVCPKEEYDEYGVRDGIGWRVFAEDAEAAAVQYALEWDGGEYVLVDGGEIDVAVIDNDGEASYFTVSGRMEPVYEARPLARVGS